MSLLPSFHTFSEDDLPSLVKASRIEREVVFKRFFFWNRKSFELVDCFWDFLREKAVEKDGFEYGGNAFVFLELLLGEKELSIFDHEEKIVSEQMRKNRDTSISVFSAEGACVAWEMLLTLNLSRNEIVSFLGEEGVPKGEISEGADAEIGAWTFVSAWLKSIKDGQMGVVVFG
jgi:hypothetical protein